MKKTLSLILVLLLAMGLCSCEGQKTKYSNSFFDAFDTIITITAYCKNEQEFAEIFDLAKSEFVRYHQLYDIYNSYDGITNMKDVNDNAASGPVEICSDLYDLLFFGKNACIITQGKCNIAFGRVTALWHNARERAENGETENLLPSRDALVDASQHCNIDDIVLTKNTVYFADPLLTLDVGAVAKGVAAEKVASTLKEKGYDGIIINAGGNVRTIGAKPDGSLWNVGIQNPIPGESSFVGTFGVEEKSVVTSGVYERYFMYDGTRYHHIIDPNTLSPENRFLSVSVVTDYSGLADAMSTALFNMDLEEGKAFVNAFLGEENPVAAMWILNDESIEYAGNYGEYIQ